MNQYQILKNRASNTINCVKHKLRQDQFMPIYNDFLILQLIIPRLDKETLKDFIAEVKKIQRALQRQEKPQISMEAIFQLLASSDNNDPLLQDYLQSAIYCDNQLAVNGN